LKILQLTVRTSCKI